MSLPLDWIIESPLVMDSFESLTLFRGLNEVLLVIMSNFKLRTLSLCILILRTCSGFVLKHQEQLSIGLDHWMRINYGCC
jgi:hypothetical protein